MIIQTPDMQKYMKASLNNKCFCFILRLSKKVEQSYKEFAQNTSSQGKNSFYVFSFIIWNL